MSQRGMYTADFETNTHTYDVSVWAYAICDIKNVENVVYGNCIDNFMKWCEDNVKSTVFFFSADQSELIAEISIGAGIHPRSDTINGRATSCHGDFSTKSALYSGCLIAAITTAATVAIVKADMIHLAIPSRSL